MVCCYFTLKQLQFFLFILEPGLPWPLYFAACCCGATLVAAAAWYCLENEILAKYFKRFFIKKEDESEKNAFTKIAKNVLSNIVYVLNRIIKTTAHILVSPVSVLFLTLFISTF